MAIHFSFNNIISHNPKYNFYFIISKLGFHFSQPNINPNIEYKNIAPIINPPNTSTAIMQTPLLALGIVY